jgi:hypothetical protein
MIEAQIVSGKRSNIGKCHRLSRKKCYTLSLSTKLINYITRRRVEKRYEREIKTLTATQMKKANSNAFYRLISNKC